MKTLGTLIATYRATLRPHLRWSDTKEYWLDCLAADLGDAPLSSVSAPQLVTYALTSPRSPLSKRYILHTLSGVLSAGVTLWGLQVPVDAAKQAIANLAMQGLLPKARARQTRIADPALDRIADHWAGSIPPEILTALVDTPLRSGELTRLRWRDVDLSARTAIIRDRKHPNGKHGNDQLIPLLGRTASIIGAQSRASEYVFPYKQDYVSQTFRRSAQRAKVRGVRLHDLRHEGISRLFDRGWTIPQVAAVSGHRSWANLKRYTHISPAQLHQLSEKE
ncbi:tyrosine-type recombinase/integrase [Qingshengfaniella alkalisoli]|uniref:Site-specific integrase n=1 Tax=Qingshengfaniella alkalisoli TaxID=2599296 RepID=A0A5B8IZU5_9RHOB|nr:site-specific integrase [Qingshengfaniella alkalisoli]QDY70138.1 site-specific integrase [Qingshengfaniella alkalisoli]